MCVLGWLGLVKQDPLLLDLQTPFYLYFDPLELKFVKHLHLLLLLLKFHVVALRNSVLFFVLKPS